MPFLAFFKKAAEAIVNFASNLLKSFNSDKPKPQQPTDFGLTSADSNLAGSGDQPPKIDNSTAQKYKSDEELAKAVSELPTYQPKPKQDDVDNLKERYNKLTDGQGWNADATLQTKINRIQEMQENLKQYDVQPKAAAQKYKTYEGPVFVKTDNKKTSLSDHFASFKNRIESIKVKNESWPSIKKDLISRLDRMENQIQSAREMSDKKRAVLAVKNVKQEIGKVSNVISTYEKVQKIEAISKLQKNHTSERSFSAPNSPKKR